MGYVCIFVQLIPVYPLSHLALQLQSEYGSSKLVILQSTAVLYVVGAVLITCASILSFPWHMHITRLVHVISTVKLLLVLRFLRWNVFVRLVRNWNWLLGWHKVIAYSLPRTMHTIGFYLWIHAVHVFIKRNTISWLYSWMLFTLGHLKSLFYCIHEFNVARQ